MLTLNIIKGDLFGEPLKEGEYYVLCISSDAAMGKGIALEFKKRFIEVNAIQPFHYHVGAAIVCANDKVINLVTKGRYFHKPTYQSMKTALTSLRSACQLKHIGMLRMPTIGCGLDRLDWDVVKEMIKEQLTGLNIQVRVFVL